TGKWPEYYADSLPASVNIGPGSPTGIVFGYGAKFPEKYQKALYILDWTYSTIYSVQLTPNGSSYQGKFEDFVTGSPLPVTDAVVGQDGTFYFTAGGRGTQSSLYRVSYQGTESTQAVQASNQDGSEQRQLRHRLESLHQTSATAWSGDQMQTILKHLDDSDRFIRYAARIALEFQPVAGWREQVLSLAQPRAQIYGLLALARQGQADDLNPIVDRLLGLADHELSEEDTLAALRTLQVALARLDGDRQALRPDLKQQLIDALQSAYPAESHSINAEVVQLLVYLESPLVVKKTLDLMQRLGAEPVPDWGYLVSRNEG
ncbi:MAG TPA: heme-binding protein, partial [Planctomycetaceae bacterium]|nr:heme-binding protein [Planctomycetaceae bacterium]